MTQLALYELSHNYLQALAFLTDPDNELPDDVIADTLEALSCEWEDKAINVAKFMRNLEVTALAMKEAEQQMASRRKAFENRVQGLKDYLKFHLERTGITQIDSPWFRLSIQNNPPAVEVFNESLIPEAFKEQVITVKISKGKIKEALKAGQEVPGAVLTQGSRLAIR